MRIFYLCLLFILLSFRLSQADDVLTRRDTLYLHCLTTTNYNEYHYDTVLAEIYHNDALVATVGLQSNGLGTWTGSYLLDAMPFGSSWVKYLAVYAVGDTMPADDGLSILDTTSFIGEAAGLTAEEIADSLRTILWSNGIDTLDVLVLDEADQPVQGVQVAVFNLAKTTRLAQWTTDIDGIVQFWLNPGDYPVLVQRIGIIQTKWDTVTVPSGGGIDTVKVESFSPNAPPSVEYCVVYGWVDTSGIPIEGAEVVAEINQNNLTYGGNLLANPYHRITNTDASGFWELSLYINSLLEPDTTHYEFWIFIPEGNLYYSDSVVVPNQASWELPY